MKIFLLLFFAITFFAACNSDNSEAIKKQLVGQWTFNNGTIDGEDGSDRLNGTAFSFTETTVTSNLLPLLGFENETMPYTVMNNTIRVNDKMDFEIKEIEKGVATISFEFAPEESENESKYEISLAK